MNSLRRIFSFLSGICLLAGFAVLLAYSAQVQKVFGWVVGFSLLALLCTGIACFWKLDFLPVLTAVFSALAFAVFVTNEEVIGSFTDFVTGVVCFGHAEFLPQIIGTAILLLFGNLFALTACCGKKP